MGQTYETTYIPCHFLYLIPRKYCTYFKPLFLTELTYFHCFPYIDLSRLVMLGVGREMKV
jgi:hypothetical protein